MQLDTRIFLTSSSHWTNDYIRSKSQFLEQESVSPFVWGSLVTTMCLVVALRSTKIPSLTGSLGIPTTICVYGQEVSCMFHESKHCRGICLLFILVASLVSATAASAQEIKNETELAIRIQEEKALQDALQTRKNNIPPRQLGVMSLIGGGVATLASGVFFILASQTSRQYQGADTTVEALRLGRNLSQTSSLFLFSATTGVLGLAFGGLSFLTSPQLDTIDRELSASIERLRVLTQEVPK